MRCWRPREAKSEEILDFILHALEREREKERERDTKYYFLVHFETIATKIDTTRPSSVPITKVVFESTIPYFLETIFKSTFMCVLRQSSAPPSLIMWSCRSASVRCFIDANKLSRAVL